jgi:hypothetical protein
LTDYDRGARAPLVISEGLRRGLGALVTAAGAACVAAGVAKGLISAGVSLLGRMR